MTLHENYLTSVPFLSFVRNHAYVAVHAGGNRLEPTIAKPAGYAEISGLGEYFATPALLVRELELDGSGDAAGSPFGSTSSGRRHFQRRPRARSILAQAPAATFGKLDLDKPITANGVLDAAMDEADEQDAARTPPANTRVTLSPTTGESFEATYGINPAFYVRILWTLALLPFVAAGFARLAGASGEPLLAAIVERVPQVTIVSDWAAAVSVRVRAARAALLRPADVDDDADSARGEDQPRGHEDSQAHLADPAHASDGPHRRRESGRDSRCTSSARRRRFCAAGCRGADAADATKRRAGWGLICGGR